MSGYNGWTNYETWCVNLWIDNERESQSYWSKVTRKFLSNLDRLGRGREEHEDFDLEDYEKFPLTEEEKHSVACDLSDRLQEETEEANPLQDHCSLFSDLLSASLSEVNYYEIAENLIAGETE